MLENYFRTFLARTVAVVFLISISYGSTWAQDNPEDSEKTNQEQENAKEEEAPAEEEKNLLQSIVRWIGPRGERLNLNWKTQTDWAWRRSKKEKGIPRPTLRTWVQIPDDYKIEEVKGADVKFDLEPEDPPFDDAIAIDMQKTTASATIIAKKGEEREEIGALIQVRSRGPGILIHKTCMETGLGFKERRKGGKHLYVGLYCRSKGDRVLAIFVHSKDSKWKGEKAVKSIVKMIRKARTAQVARVNLGHKKLKPDKAIMRFKLGSAGDLDSSIYDFYYTGGGLAGKRWFFSAGLGPTYLIYKEDPIQSGTNRTSINLREFVLTAKVAATYKLSKKFDLGANIFGNVLKITQNPSDEEFARFYGINTRIGYLLPFSGKIKYKALLGWYYWGMLVSNNAFGIKSIAGPQIVLSATAGRRPYTIYFKLAPIADSLSISFSNREIAGGVAYRINSLQSKNPLFLSLNIADTKAGSDAAGITAQVTSFSLSVDYGF